VEILEDEYHIEVLETKLDTFEMSDFDVFQSDDHEWWLGELDQAVCRWLTKDAGSERDTVEAKLTERDIDVDVLVLASFGDLLGECLEFSVKSSSASSLFLFLLEFFLVTISVSSLSVSSLIELDISSFTVELDILVFFFPIKIGSLRWTWMMTISSC
jgi:hypothetical protein